MPDSPATADPTPEEITDRIASQICEIIAESHPDCSPRFRRALVHLYALQITGLERPPGRISDEALAGYFGTDARGIRCIRNIGLARAWQLLRNHRV